MMWCVDIFWGGLAPSAGAHMYLASTTPRASSQRNSYSTTDSEVTKRVKDISVALIC